MRIIAGKARGRTIEAPEGLDTRPTLDRVRESLFNILQRRMIDARVLDLFSGSGALALEAISRGAAFAVLVDHDRRASRCETQNIQKLGFGEQTLVLTCEWDQAVRRLAAAGERFDCVFLDPPYAMSDLSQVTAALVPLMNEEAILVVEHKAGSPALVSDGWVLDDERRYGYAGISFYSRAREV